MQEESKCKACGGTMEFNKEESTLLCPYCGNKIFIKVETKGIPQPQPIVEQPKEAPRAIPSNVVLFEKSANYYKGFGSLGGNIKFYGDRLYFKSHGFNLQSAEVTIYYNQICYTEAPISLLGNSLNLTTSTGEKHKFVVSGRDEIVEFLYRKTN